MKATQHGLCVKVTETIHAPRERVMASYVDYRRWNLVFGQTITATRLVREETGEQYLEVQHRTAGKVLNVLRCLWANEFELEEFKPHYRAVFLNRFETVHNDTRYIVEATVFLKGIYRLATPFVKGLVRKKIIRYVIQPLKCYAEQDG